MRLFIVLGCVAGALLALVGCKGSPDDTPWCSADQTAPEPDTSETTYYEDVQPILDQKCNRCHVEGGIGPFVLTSYEHVVAQAQGIREHVADRHMPPWLAAGCCNKYFHDVSLTDAEIATVIGWIDGGLKQGSASDAPPPRPPIGGLSRVDVETGMKEAYTPSPPAGSTDDQRCFILDWPYEDRDVYVTGVNPVPGARDVVHHLVVAVVASGSADEIRARDGKDGRPGFDCTGALGDIDLRDLHVIGGGLAGGDFPRGIGNKVERGSLMVLNVHYSTVKGKSADRTKVQLRIDDSATEAKGIAVANPAWLVSDGMAIEAGEKDAVYFYRLEPDLFTQNKEVMIQSVSPHMHYFGSKFVLRIIREDDSRTCLLEIPEWHFGWEQPFWLAEPIRLGKDDEVYVECHFDNSAEHQPVAQATPRDIAWGNSNQDMCAGFLSFTEAP